MSSGPNSEAKRPVILADHRTESTFEEIPIMYVLAEHTDRHTTYN